MKRLPLLIISLLFALAIIAGCSSSGQNGTASSGQSSSSPKTIGDLANANSYGYAYDDSVYVMVYEDQGTYYRATAELPKETADAIAALSWEDPDHDQKIKELADPLEIMKLENLSEQILSQEELDKLIGKTGEELLNDGWETTGLSNPSESKINMDYQLIQYEVTFDSPMADTDDIEISEQIKTMTVKSISYVEISSAALNFD